MLICCLARRVVFLESRLTTKLLRKRKKIHVPVVFPSHVHKRIHSVSCIAACEIPYENSTSWWPRTIGVSALRKKCNASRTKLFDTLERPIGFARLSRRVSIGRENMDFYGALFHWCTGRRHYLALLSNMRLRALSFREAILRHLPSHKIQHAQ